MIIDFCWAPAKRFRRVFTSVYIWSKRNKVLTPESWDPLLLFSLISDKIISIYLVSSYTRVWACHTVLFLLILFSSLENFSFDPGNNPETSGQLCHVVTEKKNDRMWSHSRTRLPLPIAPISSVGELLSMSRAARPVSGPHSSSVFFLPFNLSQDARINVTFSLSLSPPFSLSLSLSIIRCQFTLFVCYYLFFNNKLSCDTSCPFYFFHLNVYLNISLGMLFLSSFDLYTSH